MNNMGQMNTSCVELLSINALKDSLCLTNGILYPYLNDNDKEPSWDGHIFIYDNTKSSKKNVKKVYVQVKGKSVDAKTYKKNKTQISKSVNVIDLENYLHDGGSMYFVILVNKEAPTDRTIYYATLTPVKLYKLLKEGNKTIELSLFPSDTQKKIEIAHNFYEDCKKQGSIRNGYIIPLNKVPEMAEITSISSSLYSCARNIDEFYNSLFDKDIYLYASIKGSNIPHPIDYFGRFENFQENRTANISIDNVTYYNEVLLIREKDLLRIKIGDSLTYIIKKDSLQAKVEFKITNSLRSRVKDTEFIIAAISAQHIMIDCIKFDLIVTSEQYNLENNKQHLTYLKAIMFLLDDLCINEDLDIETLTHQEIRELNSLVEKFDKNNIGKLFKTSDYCDGIRIIKKYVIVIQKIKIIIYGVTYNDRTILYDFINSDQVVLGNSIDSTLNQYTTIYSNLSTEEYVNLSNIDYEKMVLSYKRIAKFNHVYYNMVVLDALKLISAHDRTNNKEQLQTAKKIIEWLCEEKTDIPDDILILNLFQIFKREKELTRERLKKIATIADRNEDVTIKCAAHLLMDNQSMATYYFDQLNDEKQKEFKSWPIYKFWND